MKRLVLCLSAILAYTMLAAQPEPGSLEEKFDDIFSTTLAKGDFQGALNKFMELYQEASKGDNDELKIGILSNVAVSLNRLGQTDSALVYYAKALDLARETDNKSHESNLCVNLAVFYSNLRRLDEAFSYVEQGVLAARESEYPEDLIFALESKGALESVDDRLEDAIVTLEECLEKAFVTLEDDPDTRDRFVVRIATNLIGTFARMDGKEKELRHYLQLVEPYVSRLQKGSIEQTRYEETLAQAYIKIGKYPEAADILNDRLSSSESRGVPSYHYKKWLSRAYAGMNRWKEAYETMVDGYLELDSLSRANIQTQLTEFSARFETQQKELEIAQLKKKEAERKALIAGLIAGLVLLGAAVALLLILRKRQKQEAELSRAKEYIDGLESERSRLAKELHDGIANDLLGLEMTLRCKGPESQETAEEIAGLRENVRRISHNLIPPQLEYTDLNELLEETLQRFRLDSVRIIYEADPPEGWDDLPTETALGLYRATQELVGNALRHSGADTIRVSLARNGGQLKLSVSDNGTPAESAAGKGGIGSRTLEERMRLLGAQLEYFKDGGTCALITMDL